MLPNSRYRNAIAAFQSLATTFGALLLSPSSNGEIHLSRQLVSSSGFGSSVTMITAPPGDSMRLFVADKFGAINVIALPTPAPTPTRFLTLTGINTSVESGLLGLAFHPNYEQNGYFWVYYGGNTGWIVARGQRSAANPDIANPTVTPVLTIQGGASGHLGGWIGFGPDGDLYVSTGDSLNSNNAQDITNNLFGKVLRLDVDGPDNIPGNADDDAFPADANKNYSIPADNPFVGIEGDDEIWAYGLRNPWRCSFDRLTGDLWIGDVGETLEEEIDIIPFGTSGQNFGWPCREGLSPHSCNITPPPPSSAPWAAVYRGLNPPPIYLPISGNYIVGGIVYRGSAIPCLQGQYVFNMGGFNTYTIWQNANGQPQFLVNRTSQLPASFTYVYGEDALGELYYCANGPIYRIVAETNAGPDCNNNGIPNDCEIIQGLAQDVNANGIPDSCECDSIDFNNDTSIFDPQDIEAFLSVYSEGPCIPATATCNDIDFNNDGSVFDPADITAFLRVYSEGACL